MDKTKLTLQQLRKAVEQNSSLVSVHYACESFLSTKDHPAGIACVAFHDLQTGDTLAYSRSDAPPSKATDKEKEIHVLERFYAELQSREGSYFLHWNMNRPEYGFTALAARYEYLTGNTPPASPPHQRIDVDGLLAATFGETYAPHGRLEGIARLNNMDMRSFRTGKDEAEMFSRGEWGTLSRSTASKSWIIANALRLLVDGKILTASSAGSVEFAGENVDAVALVLAMGDRVRPVMRSLSVRSHGAPLQFKNEYDDQYLCRALLVQFFDDVRDEEYVPSYAGGNSRIDFLIPRFKLGIELKHTRDGLKDKDVGEQLVIDVARYSAHNSVSHLICLVFDYDGHLRNPRALEDDLRREVSSPEMAVTVRIYDR
ncbi:hypothetical protein SAMN05216489_05279 [Streptomyces sp. 3213]|uniref:PD-(D/E)XK nuclease domain-containing protein n=1 Tax=Streptomyces sp. 3213.3 TaxID=1855348 RepID=UPI00089899A2|nr:hypothetical protein [Streptomyces sp. 3213.3]SEE03452.1 hypothetical protein SAMN05216489_05279 [Streptomyces sp. 3213] [Streptomyces sp. 3213.3]